MTTEREKIVAFIRVIAKGPVEGQAERKGWTPEMVRYGNNVLMAMANAIELGMHDILAAMEDADGQRNES